MEARSLVSGLATDAPSDDHRFPEAVDAPRDHHPAARPVVPATIIGPAIVGSYDPPLHGWAVSITKAVVLRRTGLAVARAAQSRTRAAKPVGSHPLILAASVVTMPLPRSAIDEGNDEGNNA